MDVMEKDYREYFEQWCCRLYMQGNKPILKGSAISQGIVVVRLATHLYRDPIIIIMHARRR